MFRSLPGAAKALLWVRLLNQVGAFALAFLAVLAGPHLVTAALTSFEIYEPATSELLARVTTGAQRQDAYAVLDTSLAAAGAISGLLAAVLLPLGVRWLLVADATTCFAAATIALRHLPREPPKAPAPRQERKRWRPPVTLVRLTLAATAFAFGYLAVMMFLPFVLLQRGAPAWLPGLTLTTAALLAPAGAYSARRFLTGCPRTLLLAAGTGVLGGLALLMAGTHDVLLTASAYVAWAMTGGALLGHWPAMAADNAPEADRPRWFAFLGLSWGVAQAAVPGMVGLFAGLAGGTATAALLAGGVAFLAVPVVLAAAAKPSISALNRRETRPHGRTREVS